MSVSEKLQHKTDAERPTMLRAFDGILFAMQSSKWLYFYHQTTVSNFHYEQLRSNPFQLAEFSTARSVGYFQKWPEYLQGILVNNSLVCVWLFLIYIYICSYVCKNLIPDSDIIGIVILTQINVLLLNDLSNVHNFSQPKATRMRLELLFCPSVCELIFPLKQQSDSDCLPLRYKPRFLLHWSFQICPRAQTATSIDCQSLCPTSRNIRGGSTV